MSNLKTQFYVVNKTADNAEIYLYDYIGYSDDMPTAGLVKSIRDLSGSHKDVKLRINSGGGSVYDGIAIRQAIMECDNLDAYVDGVAASMAAILAMSAKRCYMNIYAKLMFHKPSSFGGGTADELREAAKSCDDAEADLCDILVKKTGLTAEAVTAKFLNGKDQWFTAKEAMQAGLIAGTYDGVKIEAPANLKDEKALVNFYGATLHNTINTKNSHLIIID